MKIASLAPVVLLLAPLPAIAVEENTSLHRPTSTQYENCFVETSYKVMSDSHHETRYELLDTHYLSCKENPQSLYDNDDIFLASPGFVISCSPKFFSMYLLTGKPQFPLNEYVRVIFRWGQAKPRSGKWHWYSDEGFASEMFWWKDDYNRSVALEDKGVPW